MADNPLWLHLLSPMDRAWRDKQLGKGRDPDCHIEQQLREAGEWPEKGDVVANDA